MSQLPPLSSRNDLQISVHLKVMISPTCLLFAREDEEGLKQNLALIFVSSDTLLGSGIAIPLKIM